MKRRSRKSASEMERSIRNFKVDALLKSQGFRI